MKTRLQTKFLICPWISLKWGTERHKLEDIPLLKLNLMSQTRVQQVSDLKKTLRSLYQMNSPFAVQQKKGHKP